MIRTLAATWLSPCSTVSRHVPTMARSEGQRLAKTSALAAEFIINIAPGARLDLISSAILRITATNFVGSDGISIWPRFDSLACAESAAFAVPQGPSHHQRKEPEGMETGTGTVSFPLDAGSTLL